MNQEKAMGITIKIEEAAITAIAIYFLSKYNLGLPVWLWVLLFFSPDLSMLGYLVNTRIGAFTYNLFHHRGLAIFLIAAGFILQLNILFSVGLLLLAHSSFDRMLGYGLKFPDEFKHTSSGWMGKEKIN
ncbi:DUF4260 domain-containing protein [Mucilaginibacter sp. Bleaf8]|uniref:DUF4260 domain-containing protein n=1 Tax=Mucilaginibacter sp. Bleaf8 TaxID=2834430 RepID=UPI001BCB1926|nr:DUF4260 domain-containing protein [Mucilaginibacter sp. Bleaf8]MBS7564787.1 DUF4260 domain-containing protein [Mucilaginibacter sp. Bleaf8]